MPLLNLKCSKEISEDLLKELSTVVAEEIGKPEKYVMVVAEKHDVLMSGSSAAAVCAEVKSIGGLNPAVNSALCARIRDVFEAELGIAGDRIYVTFQSVERDQWGWDGALFG